MSKTRKENYAGHDDVTKLMDARVNKTAYLYPKYQRCMNLIDSFVGAF